MFNYKQLALAIEMRTRYGKPNFTETTYGFQLDSGDLFPEQRAELIKLGKLYYQALDNPITVEIKQQMADIIAANPGVDSQTFKLTFEDSEGDYSDVFFEIWYDGNSIYQSWSLKIRNEYSAHEKMVTDLVVSQLQYWS